MIQQNTSSKQLFSLQSLFDFIHMDKILKKANFVKGGIPAILLLKAVLAIKIVGCKNIYEFSKSRLNKIDGFDENTYYRFMENENFNWRELQLRLAAFVINFVQKTFGSVRRRPAFIVDDTMLHRLRSKKVEFLTRLHDHVVHKTLKGFNMMLLAYTDGFSLFSVCHSVHCSSNPKNRVNNESPNADKRSAFGMRCKEAFMKKPDVLISMLKEALNRGIKAQHILMDSWYFSDTLLTRLKKLGIDSICLVKSNLYFYTENDERLNQKKLFELSTRENCHKFLTSTIAKTKGGRLVKLVFVRANNSKKIITVVSTDLNLSAQEIIVMYGRRWKIEVTFKVLKQHLGLSTECQARKFASIFAAMAVANMRALLIELHRRMNQDLRTSGEIFHEAVEAAQDVPFQVALNSLINLILDLPQKLYEKGIIAKNKISEAEDLIYEHLDNWYKQTAYFIQELLGNICRSKQEKHNCIFKEQTQC